MEVPIMTIKDDLQGLIHFLYRTVFAVYSFSFPTPRQVLGIWMRIRMFLSLTDPDLLVGGTDPAPDPSLFA